MGGCHSPGDPNSLTCALDLRSMSTELGVSARTLKAAAAETDFAPGFLRKNARRGPPRAITAAPASRSGLSSESPPAAAETLFTSSTTFVDDEPRAVD